MRNYRVLTMLGAGASGRILRVEDIRTGRLLAAAELTPPTLGAHTWLERDYRREYGFFFAQAFPVLGPILDFDVGDEHVFAVFSFEDPRTLSELVAHRKGLPAEEVVYLAHGLAESMHALWSARIHHGDIRPENVLVSRYLDVSLVEPALENVTGEYWWRPGRREITPPLGEYWTPNHPVPRRESTGTPALAWLLLSAVASHPAPETQRIEKTLTYFLARRSPLKPRELAERLEEALTPASRKRLAALPRAPSEDESEEEYEERAGALWECEPTTESLTTARELNAALFLDIEADATAHAITADETRVQLAQLAIPLSVNQLLVVTDADGQQRVPKWQFEPTLDEAHYIAELLPPVQRAFPGDDLGFAAWMTRTSPELEDRSPLEVIRRGGDEGLAAVLALAESYGAAAR